MVNGSKRLTVTFTLAQWKLIDSTEMGGSASEKVRSIVMSWLSNNSMISTDAKKKLIEGQDVR